MAVRKADYTDCAFVLASCTSYIRSRYIDKESLALYSEIVSIFLGSFVSVVLKI